MVHEDLVNSALIHLFEESKPFPFDKLPQDRLIYNFNPEDGAIVRSTETYTQSAEDFMEFWLANISDRQVQFGMAEELGLLSC